MSFSFNPFSTVVGTPEPEITVIDKTFKPATKPVLMYVSARGCPACKAFNDYKLKPLLKLLSGRVHVVRYVAREDTIPKGLAEKVPWYPFFALTSAQAYNDYYTKTRDRLPCIGYGTVLTGLSPGAGNRRRSGMVAERVDDLGRLLIVYPRNDAPRYLEAWVTYNVADTAKGGQDAKINRLLREC